MKQSPEKRVYMEPMLNMFGAGGSHSMKVLVCGAGVIGCYLTHVLCEAGNDVTLLARGNWKSVLETKGLTIRHHLQRKTTTDHPHITGQVDFSQHYDVVFSVTSYHQVRTILDDLAAVNADTVILVGNNLSAPDMERYLKTHSKTEKNILFGFQVTAGKREAEYAICERAGAGAMDIGFLHAAVSERQKRAPDFPMPNWDALRRAMPDWESPHQRYDNSEGTHCDGTQPKSI